MIPIRKHTKPLLFPIPLLFALVLYITQGGCAGIQSKSEYGSIEIPRWYHNLPKEDGYRFFKGTAISEKSGQDAIKSAEKDAFINAANAVGVSVQELWEQRIKETTKDGITHSTEEITRIGKILSEEPIIGAIVEKSEFKTGKILQDKKTIGKYFQGFVHLKVPEENFLFTPERCLVIARELVKQNKFKKALDVIKSASFCWPDNIEIMKQLLWLQKKCGHLSGAKATLEGLKPLSPKEEHETIDGEIERLEKELAGGEFAYHERLLKEALKKAEDQKYLHIISLKHKAKANEYIDYTVKTDRAYAYYGLWLDEEGLFLYPAHRKESGEPLGHQAEAETMSLDVGPTPGKHYFALVASDEPLEWFQEMSFARNEKDRNTLNQMADLIKTIEADITNDLLVAASFEFEVE